MHARRYAPIVVAAAALTILLAMGIAAVTNNDGTANVPTVLPAVTPDPTGADEWMYLQRANADGSIPDAAVNEAIAQSKAAGKASQGSPATDQVWTELGPSNIGGRVRDLAPDPSTKDVVYVANADSIEFVKFLNYVSAITSTVAGTAVDGATTVDVYSGRHILGND